MSPFENFVGRSNKVHEYKYSYVKFVYVNAKTQGIIICPVEGHGEFLQKPDHHTRENAIGCPKCVQENKVRVLRRSREEGKTTPPYKSLDSYKNLLLEKYGSEFQFDFNSYLGITKGSVILTCKKHGKEVHSPVSLLISDHGCSQCGHEFTGMLKTKSYDELVLDIKKVHGDKYTLLESNRETFINRKSIIKASCPEHGVFKKKAQKMLSGQGCYPCKLEESISAGKFPGGYNELLLKENPDLANSRALVYYLKINSRIYKIGITTSSIESRIKSLKSKSKGFIIDVDIISSYSTSLLEAFTIEQKVLDLYKDNRIFHRWSTELFNDDILGDLALSSFLE